MPEMCSKNDIPIGSQVGAVPSQVPVGSQARVSVPCRVYPRAHSYTATLPSVVPSEVLTVPLTGSVRGPQSKKEPRCEKTGLRGFRTGPTQTGLYSHRRWLETLDFGFRK